MNNDELLFVCASKILHLRVKKIICKFTYLQFANGWLNLISHPAIIIISQMQVSKFCQFAWVPKLHGLMQDSTMQMLDTYLKWHCIHYVGTRKPHNHSEFGQDSLKDMREYFFCNRVLRMSTRNRTLMEMPNNFCPCSKNRFCRFWMNRSGNI